MDEFWIMTSRPMRTRFDCGGDAADLLLAENLFRELHDRAFDGVGITRASYSPEESAALDVIERQARSLGLQTERDPAANLVVTLEGQNPSLPFIACGSHLDSVPQGGNFDGAAGVIAGLAILARYAATGSRPARTIKLYGLRGEESARFGCAYAGSRALFGLLTADDLAATDHATGQTLVECMRKVGADISRIAAGRPVLDARRVAAWVELHIEQGPVLEAKSLPVGFVTGIRGNLRHRIVECKGTPGHSGTIPRHLRHDAVFASAELIACLDRHWQSCLAQGDDIVVTCGIFGTDPDEHAIAKIPGKVRFSFEVRSQSEATLENFHALFCAECDRIGQTRGVAFKLDRRIRTPSATMDPGWVARLAAAAAALGIPGVELASGAGHDAAVFANAGIPTAMIFVRNANGSHNAAEAMAFADLAAGIKVMRKAIAEAAQ